MRETTEEVLSVTREILTSRVPIVTSAGADVSQGAARGASLVAWHGGPTAGDGMVGFETFHRGGRLWIGAARVSSVDEVARDTLVRTLGVVRGLADAHPSPAALITATRDELALDGESNSEVRLFVAALTTGTGELVCASAGQPAPWIIGAGAVGAIGLVIGAPIGESAPSPVDHPDHVVALAPGDVLVIPGAMPIGASEDAASLAAASAVGPLDTIGTATAPALVLRHDDLVGPTTLHTLDLRIASELDAIERVTSRFDAFAAAHHVPDATRRTFDIAFDDLLNNIVSYAYDGEPDHVIDIRVALDPTGLEASLADDGPAFDPFAMDSPDTDLDLDDRMIGGLGVHLVRSMMDEVRYERRDERNVVTIRKHLA